VTYDANTRNINTFLWYKPGTAIGPAEGQDYTLCKTHIQDGGHSYISIYMISLNNTENMFQPFLYAVELV